MTQTLNTPSENIFNLVVGSTFTDVNRTATITKIQDDGFTYETPSVKYPNQINRIRMTWLCFQVQVNYYKFFSNIK